MHVRIEIEKDQKTGMFYSQVFCPATSQAPIAQTGPVYISVEAAEADALRIMKTSFPGVPMEAASTNG